MPTTDAFIVTAVILVFIVFGAVLAWGEYQTRDLRPPVRQNAEGSRQYGSTTTIQSKNARTKEMVES